MSLLIGFLTFILVVNSMFLILLILIQLPKKEAGMGVAFGGGATDALFGAGSGTVLTKVTKYCAGVFLGLSLVLSVLNAHAIKEAGSRVNKALENKSAVSAPVVPPTTPAVLPQPGTNLLLTTTNVAAPAKPAGTNTVPAPAPPGAK